MLRGSWIVAVALGLACLTFGLGQAQEQADTGGETSEAQQPAPKNAFPPIRVEIVESDEAAEARERREREGEERDKADLIAQQGMNSATQAMNDATQKMALYGLISTITVIIGTALLIWTLLLTRKANAAAQAAVDVTREVGAKQVRANLAYEGFEIESPFNGDADSCLLKAVFKNFGQTPAHQVVFDIFGASELIWSDDFIAAKDGGRFYPPPSLRKFRAKDFYTEGPKYCGANSTVSSIGFWFNKGQIIKSMEPSRKSGIYIAGWVRYKDDFWQAEKDYRFCRFCLRVMLKVSTEDFLSRPISRDTLVLWGGGPENHPD